jgi:hypothetical protein
MHEDQCISIFNIYKIVDIQKILKKYFRSVFDFAFLSSRENKFKQFYGSKLIFLTLSPESLSY